MVDNSEEVINNEKYYDVFNQMFIDYKITKIPIEKVEKINLLGKGGQASVYKIKYEDKFYALKQINNYDIKCLIHEIAIISKLNHENIPKFGGIVLEKDILAYVFEFIEGFTLDRLDLNKLSFEKKLSIVKQVGSVLTFFHENKCIHRDLKAENILIQNKSFKVFLIDYGISKVLNKESVLTRAKGTMNYLPPETFDISEINTQNQIVSQITLAVDVWSFGCLISYIFSGIVPWLNKYKNNSTVIQTALTKKFEFPIPDNIKEPEIRKIIEIISLINKKS